MVSNVYYIILIFGQNLAIPTIVSDLPLNGGQIWSMSLEFITSVCEVCIEQKICKQIKCPGGTESWFFPVYCLFCLKKSAASNPDFFLSFFKSRNPDWNLFVLIAPLWSYFESICPLLSILGKFINLYQEASYHH